MVASTLNAFAASFAPSAQPAQPPSSGMNAFATSFSPAGPKPQREMNAFAMSFAPKVEQQQKKADEEMKLLNPFATSFAPAEQCMNEYSDDIMEAPEGAPCRLGGGHGGPTAPRDFAVGPRVRVPGPAAGIMIPVVFAPASSAMQQQVWSASPSSAQQHRGAPPRSWSAFWLEQARVKMGSRTGSKASLDGSASPVSTRLDDDGSIGCPSSTASDCDNSPASLEDVDDPAHRKGREILSLLKDFQGGDTSQLVEELETHNDLLIAKLQRQKAELCRSRPTPPGRLAFANRAECDRAIQSKKTTFQAPTAVGSGGKSWGKLTQAAEASNAQLLAELADFHCSSMQHRHHHRSQQQRYWGNN